MKITKNYKHKTESCMEYRKVHFINWKKNILKAKKFKQIFKYVIINKTWNIKLN